MICLSRNMIKQTFWFEKEIMCYVFVNFKQIPRDLHNLIVWGMVFTSCLLCPGVGTLTLSRPGRGRIRPHVGSCLCRAKTVSRRKLKLCDFYYILISYHFEYKLVPWDIHCCNGHAIVEEWLA